MASLGLVLETLTAFFLMAGFLRVLISVSVRMASTTVPLAAVVVAAESFISKATSSRVLLENDSRKAAAASYSIWLLIWLASFSAVALADSSRSKVSPISSRASTSTFSLRKSSTPEASRASRSLFLWTRVLLGLLPCSSWLMLSLATASARCFTVMLSARILPATRRISCWMILRASALARGLSSPFLLVLACSTAAARFLSDSASWTSERAGILRRSSSRVTLLMLCVREGVRWVCD